MIVSWGTLVVMDVWIKGHPCGQEGRKELGHSHAWAVVVVRDEGTMGVSRANNRFSVLHDILGITTDHRSLVVSHIFNTF